MFHNALTYLPVAIIALATLAGVAAFFRTKFNSATNKYLTDAVRARDIALADKDKEIAANHATIAEKDIQISDLKKHNKYLQGLARGGPELKLLTSEFAKLRTALVKGFKLQLKDNDETIGD